MAKKKNKNKKHLKLPEGDKLLKREDFNKFVFGRDNHVCVIKDCEEKAMDAHHIIERKLFKNGGYFLNNGVSLCNPHHLDVEKTLISCDFLRKLVGIQNIILPENFDEKKTYDKWGNIVEMEKDIQPNYQNVKVNQDDLEAFRPRKAGQMFMEANVQKILKEAKLLWLFK